MESVVVLVLGEGSWGGLVVAQTWRLARCVALGEFANRDVVREKMAWSLVCGKAVEMVFDRDENECAAVAWVVTVRLVRTEDPPFIPSAADNGCLTTGPKHPRHDPVNAPSHIS